MVENKKGKIKEGFELEDPQNELFKEKMAYEVGLAEAQSRGWGDENPFERLKSEIEDLEEKLRLKEKHAREKKNKSKTRRTLLGLLIFALGAGAGYFYGTNQEVTYAPLLEKIASYSEVLIPHRKVVEEVVEKRDSFKKETPKKVFPYEGCKTKDYVSKKRKFKTKVAKNEKRQAFWESFWDDIKEDFNARATHKKQRNRHAKTEYFPKAREDKMLLDPRKLGRHANKAYYHDKRKGRRAGIGMWKTTSSNLEMTIKKDFAGIEVRIETGNRKDSRTRRYEWLRKIPDKKFREYGEIEDEVQRL